jgi:glycyl-tRNA synthetase (class II)
LEDKSVTVRDRDTTAQIRVPIADLEPLLTNLIQGKKRFDDYRHLRVAEKKGEQ